MKFFLKTTFTKSRLKSFKKQVFEESYGTIPIKSDFFKFFIKSGKGTKSKLNLTILIKNLNYFFFFKNNFIFENYQPVSSLVEDIVFKKLNFNFFFNFLINLLKTPFIVKSIAIPKKLKRKTKKKYTIKIIYSSEVKRVRNTYKQLTYYSNEFLDRGFNVRLYKSLVFSFLE